MNNKKIILASGSPRRKELLSQIGLSFTVRVSEADEHTEETKPEKLVCILSERKALAVWDELTEEEKKESILIGADTVVAVDDRILGKPADETEAFRMIELLQGRSHQVYTGVTILRQGGLQPLEEGTGTCGIQKKQFFEKTDVLVYPMSEEEITAYVKTGEPLDKAGAYGIQGSFAAYIQGINGDYSNVVGLPVGRLYHEL
ncbi:septum formation protein Maf [Lachnospiraceae bacterium OM04-12BH]|nr:septum formation protein Maf [Lachnospiraceae bacterium OM04-12BH]